MAATTTAPCAARSASRRVAWHIALLFLWTQTKSKTIEQGVGLVSWFGVQTIDRFEITDDQNIFPLANTCDGEDRRYARDRQRITSPVFWRLGGMEIAGEMLTRRRRMLYRVVASPVLPIPSEGVMDVLGYDMVLRVKH
ncbi:hypothetical protein [Oryza sativa Japonica Group]|uniref:p0648C09.1 protein n=1 Tax=Oryza sativa subsp. japonica TaxID=39947 RepID=Q8RV56_ORYSJ|nr:P0648C09.1 [Oryza sativa Japonica Group]BAB89288.1 hypothetical protein [Oryza sativa Japonica Group]